MNREIVRHTRKVKPILPHGWGIYRPRQEAIGKNQNSMDGRDFCGQPGECMNGRRDGWHGEGTAPDPQKDGRLHGYFR